MQEILFLHMENLRTKVFSSSNQNLEEAKNTKNKGRNKIPVQESTMF
jgi:hypothetical protein